MKQIRIINEFIDLDGETFEAYKGEGCVVLGTHREGSDDYDDPDVHAYTAHTPEQARRIARRILEIADEVEAEHRRKEAVR